MQCLKLAVLLALLFFSQPVMAQQLSYPLQGYYRTGRFMPVAYEGNGGRITLKMPGAVETDGDYSESGIAPVLVVGDLGPSFHALTPEQRLVGIATGQPFNPQSLFPATSIIPIQLDVAQLLK